MEYRRAAIDCVGGKLSMLPNRTTPKTTNDGIYNEMFLFSQRYVLLNRKRWPNTF